LRGGGLRRSSSGGLLHGRSLGSHCSSFGLMTCQSSCMLQCVASRHTVPCAPGAIVRCRARPAPRDVQCHARPVPCTPFLACVKHIARFLCMHVLECSVSGVCLCAGIISRWTSPQGLSGVVRVSDVLRWTESAGTIPPYNALSAWTGCRRAACVRASACAC
jgi:hypothetical protein